MECMAIGGPSGNNPSFDLRKLFNNAGVAQNNQTEKVSSTGKETPVDTASKSAANSSERIAQLQKTLGPDGLVGTVDFNTLEKTAGANSIASSKFNGNITATSAPRQPSSVEAIGGPGVVAATTTYNAQLKLDTTRLASLANGSNAQTIEGDFNVSTANAELEEYNRLLVG
jgi:hypothetical protein